MLRMHSKLGMGGGGNGKRVGIGHIAVCGSIDG